LKLPLSKHFKQQKELGNALLPYYMEDTVKSLKEAGMSATVVETRDGLRQVQFVLKSKIIATFDPTVDPVINARDLERDFTTTLRALHGRRAKKT
jgi:hypothetical protein